MAITMINQLVTTLEHQRISPQNTMFREKWAWSGLSGFGSREVLIGLSVYRPDFCPSLYVDRMAGHPGGMY